MPTVNDHFSARPTRIKEMYDRLVALTESFGPVEQDPKKTSIHLNRQTAFAGIAVRNTHIILTIKSDHGIKNPRIIKSQQTSARRFHHEVKLSALHELDTELADWLRAAYDLCGPTP